MDEPACPGCRDHLKRLAELAARVAELTRRLEEATRAGKRQAAPFRKGPPKPSPKNPDASPGRAHGPHGHRPLPPGSVAERHQAPLPDACPHCHGPLIETGTAERFQTEIPRTPLIRQFTVHLGHCTDCGRRTQGRHPLQTSDALERGGQSDRPRRPGRGGPVAHSGRAVPRQSGGRVWVPVRDRPFAWGMCPDQRSVGHPPGARVPGILVSIRTSKHLSADETGWRVGGHNAWLHVWVGDEATGYAIDSQRSADALERVIGADWSGVLGHDGYGTYDRFGHAVHQSCLAHVLRRARELLADATRGAVRFPRQLIALFTAAIHRRNQLAGRVEPDQERERQRAGFDDRLLALVRTRRVVPAYATLAKHLHKHLEQWFSFVFDPQVEPTNWKAEQAIRPAVVNRKVWGGNRTRTGADTQGILMSVFQTCRRHARSALDYLSLTLRAFGNRVLPRPMLT